MGTQKPWDKPMILQSQTTFQGLYVRRAGAMACKVNYRLL